LKVKSVNCGVSKGFNELQKETVPLQEYALCDLDVRNGVVPTVHHGSAGPNYGVGIMGAGERQAAQD
jgi:hypothetical protein